MHNGEEDTAWWRRELDGAFRLIYGLLACCCSTNPSRSGQQTTSAPWFLSFFFYLLLLLLLSKGKRRKIPLALLSVVVFRMFNLLLELSPWFIFKRGKREIYVSWRPSLSFHFLQMKEWRNEKKSRDRQGRRPTTLPRVVRVGQTYLLTHQLMYRDFCSASILECAWPRKRFLMSTSSTARSFLSKKKCLVFL